MELTVSIVSPVYRGAGTVEELHRRLTRVAAELVDTAIEFIFVDDASPEPASWEALVSLASKDERVTAVRLARNVRQTRAVFAGAEVAVAAALGAAADAVAVPAWTPPSTPSST